MNYIHILKILSECIKNSSRKLQYYFVKFLLLLLKKKKRKSSEKKGKRHVRNICINQ